MEYIEPGATVNFTVDWADWLPTGDTISTSDWAASAGITVGVDNIATPLTTVYLTAAEAGQVYEVENAITTASGLSTTRRFHLKAQEQIV